MKEDDFDYLPDFIDISHEESLLKKIYSAPKTKWTQLSNRRLQNWGGLPHPKGMIAETIPEWLKEVMDSVSDLKIFGENRANHALVNEYQPGQGILPHHDGNLYYPCVSILSLSSHTLLDFYEPMDEDKSKTDLAERYRFSLFLEPRSLLIFRGRLFEHYMHSIAERTEDEVRVKDLMGISKGTILNANMAPTLASFKENPTGDSAQLEEDAIVNVFRRETRVSITIRHVPRLRNIRLLK